ncbi:Alpha/beta hydrolase family protein [Cellulosimicrobium aquatile]|uniref:Alpha/beta hydrolase family protein n=1 Tax=Cellulosimicrobium aquatile TaxID=1612203 RepID=A0A1N6R918_9MICO|nr:alpha/beta hydrolase [Cellulosimicrobium aquatile]SIQ25307.1 Alpha/beta hydrolase family protein [Cellulosimicrobium aquatile]
MARRRQLTTRSTSSATADDDTQHVTERVRFARARSGASSAPSTVSAASAAAASAGTAEVRCAVGDLTAVVHVSGADAPDVVVVLVHGVGSSARAFDPVRRALLRPGALPRVAVHAIDLPGFGAAPRASRDVSIEEHAAVVAEHVRRRVLDLPDGAPRPVVVLVGHSMGGQVVAQAMADHPREAPAGVLVGPTADRDARSAPRQALRLARDAVGERPRALGTLAVDYVLRCSLPHYARQVRHMLAHRLEDVVPRVPGRLVVVRGAHDPIAPRRWCRELALAAPRGMFREVRGRHHAMDADPEGIVAAVRDAGGLPRGLLRDLPRDLPGDLP